MHDQASREPLLPHASYTDLPKWVKLYFYHLTQLRMFNPVSKEWYDVLINKSCHRVLRSSASLLEAVWKKPFSNTANFFKTSLQIDAVMTSAVVSTSAHKAFAVLRVCSAEEEENCGIFSSFGDQLKNSWRPLLFRNRHASALRQPGCFQVHHAGHLPRQTLKSRVCSENLDGRSRSGKLSALLLLKLLIFTSSVFKLLCGIICS